MGDRERRHEQYRSCSQALALLWLVGVWCITLTAPLFWDSGPIQGLYWVLFIGFLMGLIPWLIVNMLVARHRLNPPAGSEPEERPPVNWRLYGVLGLILFVVMGLNWLTAR